MSKIDRYLIHAFTAAADQMSHEVQEGRRSGTDTIFLPMLIRVNDPSWDPSVIPDCTVMARLGNIVACLGSMRTVEALKNDPAVLAVEASRPASSSESSQSIPFVRANTVHFGPFSEKGDEALIAIIDTDIDVLHDAFLDPSGNSTRIRAIWDQTDPSGPAPRVGRFGTEHTESQINSYIRNGTVPRGLGRVSGGHGTHVTSIAAGRPLPVSQFLGGVAPEANIIVVIPSLEVGPTDPFSIGYSLSIVAALAYIDDMAQRLDLPVVVNLSQGMNAGAHDGTSLIESAFDKFADNGRAPGRVVVKSAGNERKKDCHACLNMGSNQSETLEWNARPHKGQDVIELWFKACDEMRFCLHSPSATGSGISGFPSATGSGIPGFPSTHRRRALRQHGPRDSSSWIDRSNSNEDATFSNGNSYYISYERYHRDNGDSRLTITITPSTSGYIEPGMWSLEIVSGDIKSSGEIHAWMERSNDDPPHIHFMNNLNEEATLTIPGTANTVISVGSVAASTPYRIAAYSSFGPTRDGRKKPDIAAPGEEISGALGNTFVDLKVDSGTSMAAPHVTGAIALLLSYWRKQRHRIQDWEQLNAAQIRSALSQTTQNYNGHWNHGMGFGVLDIEELLRAFD